MKKHILILFLLSIVTLSAFGQAGSLSQSVYRSRVNDSTTVNGAHASGYGDFYWNNQDTNPGWRVWNGTSYDIGFSAGGNFWKNAGTTTLTGDAQINLFDQLTFSSSALIIDMGNTPNGFIARGNFMQIGTPADESYIQFSGSASADILISTADDVNIGAGQSGSLHDVNITANYGHVHLTASATGLLFDTSGPITINTDPGTAGDVLQSNGAGAAPTWGPVGLTGTSVLNFDLTSVNSEDLTITVTGAADGDAVLIGVPNVSATANVIYTAWTSGANTVTIRASRIDVASGADPASGTFRASVLKY